MERKDFVSGEIFISILSFYKKKHIFLSVLWFIFINYYQKTEKKRWFNSVRENKDKLLVNAADVFSAWFVCWCISHSSLLHINWRWGHNKLNYCKIWMDSQIIVFAGIKWYLEITCQKNLYMWHYIFLWKSKIFISLCLHLSTLLSHRQQNLYHKDFFFMLERESNLSIS